MADMRRIGERRNTEAVREEPARAGLLPRLSGSLPFSSRGEPGSADKKGGRSAAASSQAVDRLGKLNREQQQLVASLEASGPPPLAKEPVAPVAADPFAETPKRLATMTGSQAARPLHSDANMKAAIGAGFGGAAGFAATGTMVALPAGMVVGGLGGFALARRMQSAAGKSKTLPVKRKQADALFAAFEDFCVPFAINTPAFAVKVDQSAAFRLSSSGKPSKRKLDITIGLPLLAGLSTVQIQALFAQALGRVLDEEAMAEECVAAALVADLDQLHAKRSKKKPSKRLQALTRHVQSAQFAWASASADLDRAADRRAAPIVGAATLADALLAQGLIAQRFWDDVEGQSFQQAMAALQAGYGQDQLNLALQGLAAYKAEARSHVAGVPLHLLDRIATLDTSIPVPQIPASLPVIQSMDDKFQAQLGRKLAGIKAQKAAKAAAKPKAPKPPKAQRTSLFARFKRKTPAAGLPATTGAVDQLYDADSLFKTDPGVGLESYQNLVDAHPRWALARLRLAEAQIECGLGEGVGNLMMAAEQLPSAMPTILSTLHSALPMVSPLEEEPLRQAIERMWTDADAMAAERAQIDLLRMETPRMDEADKQTLCTLFTALPGLREVWVFNVPCVYAPEVPHHAILGLAPRLGDDDVDALAMQIAEHAAILGTVAVHIETGTPRSGLGDALASQPSLWRAGRSKNRLAVDS